MRKKNKIEIKKLILTFTIAFLMAAPSCSTYAFCELCHTITGCLINSSLIMNEDTKDSESKSTPTSDTTYTIEENNEFTATPFLVVPMRLQYSLSEKLIDLNINTSNKHKSANIIFTQKFLL